MILRRVFAHLGGIRLVPRLLDGHSDVLPSTALGPPDQESFLSVPTPRRTHPSWPTGTWIFNSSNRTLQSSPTGSAAYPPPNVLLTSFESRTGHGCHMPDQSRDAAPRGIPGLDATPLYFPSGSLPTGWLARCLCARSTEYPPSLGDVVTVATGRPLDRLLSSSASIHHDHSLPERKPILRREYRELAVVDMIVTCVKSIDLQSCTAPDGTALLDRLEAAIEEKVAISEESRNGLEGDTSSRHRNNTVIEGHHVTSAMKMLSNGVLAQGLLHWAVRKRQLYLRPQIITAYIEALGRARDLCSLGLLEQNVQQLGLTLDDFNYVSLTKVACSLGTPDLALKVLEPMKSKSGPLTASQYGSLMVAYKSQGRYGKVFEVFEEMKKSGVQMNLYLYGIIIDACRQVRDVDSAKRHWDDMIAQGLRPSSSIVSSMLTMYKRVGDFEKATDLFRSLSELEVPMSKDILNAFMGILCKQGLASEAESLLQRALKDGHAELATWGPLVHMYGTRHGALDGLKCFLRSVEAGSKPDEQNFAVLLHVLLYNSSLAEAEHLLRHLKAHGPRPGLGIVCPLLMAVTESDEEKLPGMVHLLKASGHEVVKLLLVLAQAYKGRELTTAHKFGSAGAGAHFRVEGELMAQALQSAASIAEEVLVGESATTSKGVTLKRRFSNTLLELLETLGLEEAADVLLPLFFSHHVYDANVSLDLKQWKEGACRVDLHEVSPRASAAILRFILERLKHLKRDCAVVPSQLVIITGWGRTSSSYNVKSTRRNLGVACEVLKACSIQFRAVNQGRLSVSGDVLRAWLEETHDNLCRMSTPQAQDHRLLELMQHDAQHVEFKENHDQLKVLQKALEKLQ